MPVRRIIIPSPVSCPSTSPDVKPEYRTKKSPELIEVPVQDALI
jgi:hypothetical protein